MVKVWARPLCLFPTPTHPFSALLCPAFPPEPHHCASCLPASSCSHSMGSTSRGMREERIVRLETPVSLAPSLQYCCVVTVPWLKVSQPTLAPGSGAPSTCLLRPRAVAALTAASLGTALSHVVSSLPANTSVNSPLIEFPSNYPIWVQHLFLAKLWLIQGYLKRWKFGKHWYKENLPIFPQDLSDPTKPSRYGKGGEWQHLLPLPSSPLLFQVLLSNCYFNVENSASTVFSYPTDCKSHFLVCNRIPSQYNNKWFICSMEFYFW